MGTRAVGYTRATRSLGDRYLVLLSGLLMGYALVGKGFAYLGYPPVFIGEIVFFTGLAIFLRRLNLPVLLATWPTLLLAATMAWVTLRTIPFLEEYGVDALRDSTVIMYGGFAFIVIGLLLEDCRRVTAIVRYYDKFVSIFIPIIPIVLALEHFAADSYSIPNLPGSNVPLVEVRPEEAAVHLAGVALFVIVGFRKVTRLWTILYVASALMASVSRGGMVAMVIPVVFATLVLGKVRRLIGVFIFGLALFFAAYSVETAVTDDYEEPTTNAERSISTHQIMDNLATMFGSGDEQMESTVTWRTDWWEMIIANTVHGPYFWTGRGFGLNLAQADGFEDGDHPDRPPLRSPHNVNMTLLARTGVPGLALWGTFLVSWFGMLWKAMLAARRRGHSDWAGLFLFIGCYVMAALINASFDVALEGPMQGIWFWCLIGFGIGSVMIYRSGRRQSV